MLLSFPCAGNAKITKLEVFVLLAAKHSRDESDTEGPGVQEIILSGFPSETTPFFGGGTDVQMQRRELPPLSILERNYQPL